MSNDRLGSAAINNMRSASVKVAAFYDASSGKKKPGGTMVAALCAEFDLKPEETLVIGKDRNGVLEAMNGRSLGFHATWAGVSDYGIKVDSPAEFFEYLDIFFSKKHLWYATFDGADLNKKPVHLRSLIDGNGAGNDSIKNAIYHTLKKRTEWTMYGASVSKVLMLHLLASSYLAGFFSAVRSQVGFEIYPGHATDSLPPPVIDAIISGFTLFRTMKQGQGLVRHTSAIQSHAARLASHHGSVRFSNQMQTVHVASAKLRNKRIIVFDDFLTRGYSLEAARTLFQQAGAAEVYGITVGKYGPGFDIQSLKNLAKKWDARVPVALSGVDFIESPTQMKIDPAALTEFLETSALLQNSKIGPKLHPQ